MTRDDTPMIQIRSATHADLPALAAFDPFKAVDADAVDAMRCHVAVLSGEVAGYVMVHRHFFRRPFVEFLVVHPDHRRQGVATALLDWAEAWAADAVGASQLWVSTGQDNATMQRVLISRGYRNSGLIADIFRVPELVYYKALDGGA